MLFNSHEFIFLYLPITLFLYYKLARVFSCNIAKYFLILASLIFYSYWDISNLPILLFSVAVNYLIGCYLQKNRNIYLLVIGVVFNISYLVYFKYANFLIDNINYFFQTEFVNEHIGLPLGISFFTFTQTAYLVDVYRGETKEYTKSDFLLFVTIFPHLIAGPILYHKDIIPQFSVIDNYKIRYNNLLDGILWFFIGLFKKVVIADRLSLTANTVFSNTANLSFFDAWFGTIAYSLQLYFDFSGYSEMAIGLGLMLNYKLPINFNSPYRATSIIDFWRRWHITLSNFLKYYLYIPLGGNKTGHHLRNIMITMLLGGLWHGANWTFLFWGGLHGIFICINHLWRKLDIKINSIFAWILTFNAVNFAWIFFRADNFSNAINIIHSMFLLNNENLFLLNFIEKKELYIILVSALLSVFLSSNDKILLKIKYNKKVLFLLIIFFTYTLLSLGNNSEFLYFQF